MRKKDDSKLSKEALQTIDNYDIMIQPMFSLQAQSCLRTVAPVYSLVLMSCAIERFWVPHHAFHVLKLIVMQ